MMRTQIDILLEKYWNGETSLAEEATLRSYFSSEDVAEDLVIYKAFFTEINEQNFPEMSADFDDKILARINEEDTKIVALKSSGFRQRFLQIAAALTILMGTALFVFSDITNTSNTISETEKLQAEKAYKETVLALSMVSKKMKKAQNPLKKLGKMNQVFALKVKK